MQIKEGTFLPGPHLAKQLLDFPDSDLTQKQVQQFLGIINYIKDFIPQASLYTTALSSLLKKNPPHWDISHTEVVAHLKSVSQKPLPLHIPSSGQLILQTDVSDHFWGAILIEEIKGKRYYCSHAS
ncbi:hypothetical protein Ddye_017612 [Dipteronia dyeriana]|uniref:Reverse transcriptase/retrotransposon-derived protein RNase H-like domain-containing protein n=1 Tax=Dipteronia dyeriana TaxID=168575 RepID=A0AAD9U9Q9_9ROSI|nr:hypothetical protein Ddye_017612 [Dipteronia dyeriana]